MNIIDRAKWVCVMSMFGLIGTAQADAADGYALRNDTDRIVIVQEVVSVDGQPRRVKPRRLSPGETTRELLVRPTVKKLVIFDPYTPTEPLFIGQIFCEPGNGRFLIRHMDDQVEVVSEPVLQVQR